MSRKILVLMGSPRKDGNCDCLCSAFIRGAEEAGHTAEKIYLQDQEIHGCLGCGACGQKDGNCVQNDGMKSIYEKMIASDVIVLASPVYFDSWSSQMKAVLDRTTALEHNLGGKTFYLLAAGSSADAAGAETLLECFRKYIHCFAEENEGGSVFAAGADKIGDARGSEAEKQAYALGREVC